MGPFFRPAERLRRTGSGGRRETAPMPGSDSSAAVGRGMQTLLTSRSDELAGGATGIG